MEDVRRRFMTLLEQTLIPDFCSQGTRKMNPSGFRGSLTSLSDIDMADFLRGWEAQLLRPIGGGLYSASQGGASEQFFWSGSKAGMSRTFTISVEPVISLGVLARMHLDFGWPKKLIGTQTKPKWAFDVFGYKSECDQAILIACEVKKSRKEIDALIGDMRSFGRQPSLLGEHLKGAKRNAFMKVKALRDQTSRMFWAVGPARYEKVFSVQYLENGVVEFQADSTQALRRALVPELPVDL